MPAGDNSAALRVALADAERMRDEALARCAAMQEQRQDERRDGQHQLRNSFSVIRAIVRRTGEEAGDVEEYCGLLEARLSSYFRVQAALARDWSRGLNLELLILDELLIFGLASGERIHLNGPPIELTSRAAGLMALAFHDLLSVLVVDGFEEKDGTLDIDWSLETDSAEPLLLIDWKEAESAIGNSPARSPARPSADRHERPPGRSQEPSPWSASLRLAIEHQLAGTMQTAAHSDARSASFRLPVPCFQEANTDGV